MYRRQHHSGHVLDVVVTHQHVLHDLTVKDMISDHNLLLCMTHHPKPSPMRVTVTTRNKRGINMADIQEELESLAIPSDDDVVILIDHYNQSLIPKCEKRKLGRTWRRTRLTVHKETYCKSVVTYNKMLGDAHAKFYNNKVVVCDNDSKVKLPINSSAKDLVDRFAHFFEA
ncbi:hypothetical protein LSH36_1009g01002 [Paralvinella palmiformis]|uniref:Uncharacterized protein n=1 Tax=Paralvinella palmiformis TaxID=53620 RepID=A0AAD9IWN8_9ANNE|nr:hypothetical protein LSH36_1009g01002 [Paralvinella palmiformis]